MIPAVRSSWRLRRHAPDRLGLSARYVGLTTVGGSTSCRPTSPVRRHLRRLRGHLPGVTVGRVDDLACRGRRRRRRQARRGTQDPQGHQGRRREPLGGGGAVPRLPAPHATGARTSPTATSSRARTRSYPLRVDQLLQRRRRHRRVGRPGRPVDRGRRARLRLRRRWRGRPRSGSSTTATPSPSAATEALPQTSQAASTTAGSSSTPSARRRARSRPSPGTSPTSPTRSRAADPDLRLVLDRGVVASQQLEALIKDNQANLAALLANLITVGPGDHLPASTASSSCSSPTPTSWPAASPSCPATARPTSVSSWASRRRPCTRGYGGTSEDRARPDSREPAAAQHQRPVHRCRAGRASDVRGAQNAPGP